MATSNLIDFLTNLDGNQALPIIVALVTPVLIYSIWRASRDSTPTHTTTASGASVVRGGGNVATHGGTVAMGDGPVTTGSAT